MKKLVSLVLALVMVLSLASCFGGGKTTTTTGTQGPAEFDLEYAEGTVLRMATGYNNLNTGLFFSDADWFGKQATDGVLKLADGKEYRVGDLKPTWAEVESRLNIEFVDKWTGAGSAQKEYNVHKEDLSKVDMVAGTASQLSEAGVAGDLINIAEYLDHMPNFKAYLEANPIVRLSITADTTNGAIYFSPYFDGVDDIERMPLMRTDWVEKLLNGEGEFTAEASKTLATAVYTPYMPTSGKVTVDAVNKDGTAVIQLTKDYDKAGNIVALMNAAGTIDGVTAVNMLRKYIDEAYNGYYGTNRADLFIGQDAAWDADELVALLRCVVSNPQTLNGTDTVHGLFSRNDDENKRKIDMFRFAGTLFGVRGLESRQDYLYIDSEGNLRDARQEEDTYIALERMNAMAKEGLISDSFMLNQDTETKNILAGDLAFMHYDYNQTQTVYNETALQEGEKYMAVMVPVARWNDGTGEQFFRFTESWRSVKTDGWAISKAGVGNDTDKLHAALALIDYAYSREGQILMSYGPDDFIAKNADGSLKMFSFNGQDWPVISNATYDELWKKASGNYTNYARQFLGSTLSFVKSQSFEYQCTHIVGKEGAGKLSIAIGLGVIRHPELAITENPWWTSVPTVLPTTKEENTIINGYSELGSKGEFITDNGGTHLFVDIIIGGYAHEGVQVSGREALVNKVVNDWHGKNYLEIKNDAWEKLQDYYNEINK